MHRLLAKLGLEPQGEQVEVAVHKAVETELGHAIFASLVVHHALTDFGVAGILSQVRNVAVHVAIHLNVLHHLAAISLQTAVEVVKIVNAAHLARCGVEQFGGNGFGFGVVTLLFPTAHQIVALLGNHLVEVWNFVGAVLQVGVHGDDHIALHTLKTSIEGRRLAVVAAETHALDIFVFLMKFLNHFPRVVGAAVVDHQHLVGEVVFFHHALNPFCQFGQRFGFVIQWNYY